MTDPLDYARPPGDMRLRRVYSAADAMEAELLVGLLDREGIAAVVHGAATNAVLGTLLGSRAAASVWVRDEDQTAATDLIARFKRGELRAGDGDGAAWKCPGCGESIEPQFTECWQCGTERGATAQPKPVVPLPGDALDYETQPGEESEESRWARERAERLGESEERAADDDERDQAR